MKNAHKTLKINEILRGSLLEAVLKPFMDYFTHLFPFEKLNFKSNKSHYYFQNKISQIKIYKQTNLKKGFKTAS